MGRKKEYVTTLNHKDAKVAQCLYYSKTIHKDDILTIITKNRLDNYKKQGLVEKCSYKNSTKISKDDCYKLTDKGLKFFKNNYKEIFEDTKRYAGTSVRHDMVLGKALGKLSYEEIRTVQSEAMCRDRLNEYLEELKERDILKYEDIKQMSFSMPDCVYTTSAGIEVCIEIVTQFYKEESIIAKQNYCQIFNIQYQQIKI